MIVLKEEFNMPIDTVYSVVSEVVEVSMDSVITSTALKNAYDLYHGALSNIIVIVGIVFAVKLILESIVSKKYIDYKIKMEVLGLNQKITDLGGQVEKFGKQYQSEFFYKQIEFNVKFAQAVYEGNNSECNIPSFLHFYNALNYLVELEPNHKWYFSLLPVITGVDQNWKSVSSKGASSLLDLFARIKEKINEMKFVSISEKARVMKEIEMLCTSIRLRSEGDDRSADTAPDEGDDRPADTAPDEGDDRPADAAPGEGDDRPADAAPGEGNDRPADAALDEGDKAGENNP